MRDSNPLSRFNEVNTNSVNVEVNPNRVNFWVGGGWGRQLCCSINMFFLLGAGYMAIPIMYSQRLSGFLEFLSAVLEFQIIVVVALK